MELKRITNGIKMNYQWMKNYIHVPKFINTLAVTFNDKVIIFILSINIFSLHKEKQQFNSGKKLFIYIYLLFCIL